LAASHYRRENKIAVINALDVETPETLSNSSASCLIKMRLHIEIGQEILILK
jgi:hypothetical protein